MKGAIGMYRFLIPRNSRPHAADDTGQKILTKASERHVRNIYLIFSNPRWFLLHVQVGLIEVMN